LNPHRPRIGGAASRPRYSGKGLPRVSGRKGSTNKPIRNTPHIVMPAYRSGWSNPENA
jgi:hypothetical protein